MNKLLKMEHCIHSLQICLPNQKIFSTMQFQREDEIIFLTLKHLSNRHKYSLYCKRHSNELFSSINIRKSKFNLCFLSLIIQTKIDKIKYLMTYQNVMVGSHCEDKLYQKMASNRSTLYTNNQLQ